MIIRYSIIYIFFPLHDTCDYSKGPIAFFIQFSFHTLQYVQFESSVFIF